MPGLRKYQNEAVSKTLSHVRNGRRSVCIVSPPGSGKTRMGIVAALQVAAELRRPTKVLCIAHRAELIRQLQSDLAECNVEAGIIAPWARRTNHVVQVASVQSLDASDLPQADVVLWDECHHVVADSYYKIFQQLSRSAIHIGLTATPDRYDGKGLYCAYKSLVVAAQRKNLIRQGYLVPTDVLSPRRMLTEGLADIPVKLWERHAKGTRTIVFARNVDDAKRIAAEFAKRGWPAAYVEGDMNWKVRKTIIDRFREGRTMVMVNCQILTEGFNLPCIDTVVLARPIGHPSLYLQMVGRAGRPYKGKKRALCLDLVGNWKMHGLPDERRRFALNGKPIALAEKGKVLRRCKRCSRMWRTTVSKTCPYCRHTSAKRRTKTKYLSERLTKASKKQMDEKRQNYFDQLWDHRRNMGYDMAWVERKFVRRFGVSCQGMRRSRVD